MSDQELRTNGPSDDGLHEWKIVRADTGPKPTAGLEAAPELAELALVLDQQAEALAELEADAAPVDEFADPALGDPDRAVTYIDDQPVGPAVVETVEGERRRVVPEWMTTRAGRRTTIALWLRAIGESVAFHGVRLPLYWARVVGCAPRGVGRVVVPVVGWANGRANRAALAQVAAALESSHHAGLAQQYAERVERHQRQVRTRWALVATAGVVAGWLAWARWAADTSLVGWLAALAVLATVFGLVGQDRSRPVVSVRVFRGNRPRRPDASVVVDALRHCGIGALASAIKADPEAVHFTGPAVRSGPGWRIDCDLPAGVTAGEVAEKRASIAATLRRPLGCVWPEGDPDQHEARLVLYVADRPLAAGEPLPWRYSKAGTVNLFTPVEIGLDKRGEPVAVTLMFASGIIGALPRMGKSFLLRLLVLAAGLDQRSRVYVYNLKGGADFNACRHFAHAYRSGDSPEDLNGALAELKELRVEMRRRYQLLERLALERPDVCPEGKITDELASDPTMGLEPVVVGADEVQVWFSDADDSATFEEICTDLVKRGPAVGITLLLATQRVDSKSIPTGISSNAVLRWCLKVMGQVENDMVLGTSMYKAGFRATSFSRRDLGIAYLAGEGADPIIVKAAYVDGPTADQVALRARTLRERAGLLTGMAAGDETEPDSDELSFLDHLRRAWPDRTPKASHVDMAAHLAAYAPDTFGDITPEQVSARGRSHGLAPVANCKGPDGKWTLKGFALTDVVTALAERDTKPTDEAAT
jgi:S-DNA-T family DNA segregation ATPase FtsK/SpoIIIE